ncbi:MAG: type I restriction enzyme HsdR N-terminal domain-containing protein [Bacteroidetes bacterium]|nr:type I restriction enzyme HsdR N-terminal domain-containing protein [Bacteroidota bacterium]
MDFKDQIKILQDRVIKLKDQLTTEEATKQTLVLPFIQTLGYDVFNPTEVVPEFTADVGFKKGEKVDYAILLNNRPIILIECKTVTDKLESHDTQLIRYFQTTKAKFAILTNGINYKFYTDLVEVNKLDEKPFLEVDFLNLKDQTVAELKKFSKPYFNIDEIFNSASELKYSNEIKNILSEEFKIPSSGFVKYFTSRVYDGTKTEKILSQFTEIIKKTLGQWLSDQINERLKSVMEKETQEETPPVPIVEGGDKGELDKKKEIITTQEELEGFYIVKSILRQKVTADRVSYKDTLNYFAINILSNNIKKPICRLRFSPTKKYITLFDEKRNEIKYEIKNLDEIFNFSDQLLKSLEDYLK